MRIYEYWKNDLFGNNQGIVREELPHFTMTKSIPVKVLKVEKGKVVVNAIANNKHLNTQCGVHGGFASTVLDFL